MRKLVFLVVAACSSPAHHNPVIIGHDAPEADSPKQPDGPIQGTAVTIESFGNPQVVAYRDGQGAWQTATGDGQGNYTIYVTNDYVAVVACATGTTSDVETLAATISDGTNQFVFCNPPPEGPAPQTVAITGHMVQAGTVDFFDSETSPTGPWDFTLNVTPGTHDLVAMSTSNEMVIRRDQSVTAAGSASAIDTSQEGSAMVPATLTVNGIDNGETPYNGLDLLLSNDFVSWTTSSATIETPPPSLLMQNDYLFLFAEAYTDTRAHWADTQFDASQTEFMLLPLLDGVQFSVANAAVVATWGTLPTNSGLTLNIGSATRTQTLMATQSWIAATNATQLTFDAMPPAVDPTWAVDLHAGYVEQFQASSQNGPTSYGTSVIMPVNGAARSQLARSRSSMIAAALGRERLASLARAHRSVPRGVPPYPVFASSGAPASIK